MYKLDLGKAEEPQIKSPTSIGSSKKQGNSRKTLLLLVCITVENSSKDGNNTRHLTFLQRNLYAMVRTGHGTMDWFKTEKEYIKAVYCLSASLTSMQSTPCKISGWRKHKLESGLPGIISIISDTWMTPP